MTWQTVAQDAAGWLHEDEGAALRHAAQSVAHLGALAEIGGYAGKSACWLGSVAKEHDTVLFSIDWHRGSPEMAVGRECHDPDMVGLDGVHDTLPHFRQTIRAADLEPWVVSVAGTSTTVGKWWRTPLAFLFIDGAHDGPGVLADWQTWSPRIVTGGIVAFHDTTIEHVADILDLVLDDGWLELEQVETVRMFRR